MYLCVKGIDFLFGIICFSFYYLYFLFKKQQEVKPKCNPTFLINFSFCNVNLHLIMVYQRNKLNTHINICQL